MTSEFNAKGEDSLSMSPLTATLEVSTEYLLNYLKQYESVDYKIGFGCLEADHLRLFTELRWNIILIHTLGSIG